MYRVCTSKMQIVSQWTTLAGAKASAILSKREYPAEYFFVCDHTGAILAGY